MREELLAAIAPREESVSFKGHTVIVRELECAADVPETEGGRVIDFSLQLVVLCTWAPGGERLFEDGDLAALRKAGRTQLKPLIDAALRVNGLNVEAEAKNSDAAPAGG